LEDVGQRADAPGGLEDVRDLARLVGGGGLVLALAREGEFLGHQQGVLLAAGLGALLHEADPGRGGRLALVVDVGQDLHAGGPGGPCARPSRAWRAAPSWKSWTGPSRAP